ncbi:MAG: FG-GAP-like repeat-containing protein [Bacteroidota bacterium]
MKYHLLFVALFFSQILFAQNFTEITQSSEFEDVWESAVAFADVDGDEDLDVIISGVGLSAISTKLYLNDGTGTFTEVIGTTFDPLWVGSAAFSDVDDDGDPDVLLTGINDSSVRTAKLYQNDGMGNFTEIPNTPFVGVRSSSIAFADVDGDDIEDLLITGLSAGNIPIAELYLNDGNGNFALQAGSSFEGVWESSIAFSDVDGDDDQDVLLTGINEVGVQISTLYLNDGNGTFSEVLNTNFEAVWLSNIAFGDVTGDEVEDLIITGENNDAEILTRLYINDGNGNFTEMTNSSFDDIVEGIVAFTDVDLDDDLDVLLTGISSSNMIIAKWYLNDGTGNFSEVAGTPFIGILEGDVAFADIDDDGDEDVLFTGFNSPTMISSKLYRNDLVISSTNNLALELNLSVFPNPVRSNILNIRFESLETEYISIQIFQQNGQLIHEQVESVVKGRTDLSIDVRALPLGHYFVQLQSEHQQGSAPFVVQH